MTNYKNIHGTNIEIVSSDPSNPVNGQVWYNSTDGKLRGSAVSPAGSWASGNNLNTARFGGYGGVGIQTAALLAGGETGTAVTGKTESYDGTNWTEVNDMNTDRREHATAGSYTSAITAGGNNRTAEIANSESWNGTNWTEVNDLNSGRNALSGAGTDSTSALAFGAESPSPTKAFTESWNGTNWTEVTDLGTGRAKSYGTGASNTSALAFGGEVPPVTAATEEWTAPTITTREFTVS